VVVSVTVGEELYGLPLEEFIAQRASLAKSLRAKGRRDDARAVAALRKPSVAAWAVNQLIRTRAAENARLFSAGDQMRSVQDGLLAGKTQPAALREAAAAERVARDELVEIARGLLSASGHELSGSTLSRVDETLHAASLDPDARAELADGCLVKELRLAGLGIALGSDSPAGAATSVRPQKRSTTSRQAPAATASRRATDAERSEVVRSKREDTSRLKAAEQRRNRAAATLKDADRSEVVRSKREDATRLKRLRRDEEDAGRAARRAASELQAAEQRRDRAAATLNDAERTLDKATVRAEATEGAHREAVAARKAFQAATNEDPTH